MTLSGLEGFLGLRIAEGRDRLSEFGIFSFLSSRGIRGFSFEVVVSSKSRVGTDALVLTAESSGRLVERAVLAVIVGA